MLGATPDAILIIENDELVPVEIKCPWRWAHNLEVKYVEGKTFVQKGDGHAYYFQLQLQILLCKVKLNILVIFAFVMKKIECQALQFIPLIFWPIAGVRNGA